MNPHEILDDCLQQIMATPHQSFISDSAIAAQVALVCRNLQNRAGVRLVMACALAKIHNPAVDIRKPYTEIGDADSFSGRTYDERYIEKFILQHRLPCNPTTAFLTPALRVRHTAFKSEMDFIGRPKELYQAVLLLLGDESAGRITAVELLLETIRVLLEMRDEQEQRIVSLLADLQMGGGGILTADSILRLIEQHLAFRGSSRLPVLVVAAAYQSAAGFLGENLLPIEAHTAADRQTQALGDLQITLASDDRVVTCYEMKMKPVTPNDIDQALLKIAHLERRPDNYIFITTEPTPSEIHEYARRVFERSGVEFAILDCLAFLRHFLYLFYRLRIEFLEAYQHLVLNEPESAVTQPLKEAFLSLRRAAESEI